jgi:SEC-C motif-containing protein
MEASMSCPCGSKKTYEKCCGPFLAGEKNPSTAEELMRSRYTAYTKHDIDYVEETHSLERRDALDVEETRKWAEESEWKGLEILRTEAGGANDDTGVVEFIASFAQDGVDYEHHEVSTFHKVNDMWYFHDGYTPSQTVVREEAKVGRNDPCPCGSGKKYKKCCGK